jgi:hypothetical protein
MPSHKLTEQTIADLRKYAQKDIDIHFVKQAENVMATFLVVDRKFSLVMEIRDDLKKTFDESIGLSVYSTSKAGVLSYVSLFKSLWSQTELYEQLKFMIKCKKSSSMLQPMSFELLFSLFLDCQKFFNLK